MTGSHLDRVGFRHLVMAIATLATLTGALFTNSSFVGSFSDKNFVDTPTIQEAYTKTSRYGVVLIALNSSVAFVVVLMSFIVDWHCDVVLPAYRDYAWIGVAWCIQLVSIIIVATVANPSSVCDANNLALGENWTGSVICSNWKAILVTSIIAITALTFHVSWHMIFRLCYKSVLANHPTTPFDFWKTPLPRKYLVRLKGRRRQSTISVALGGKSRMTPTPEPSSSVSTPVAAQNMHANAEEAARDYFTSAVAAHVSADDLEKGIAPDNVSIASSRVGEISPPGLEIAAETRRSHTADH